jgi:nucleotide-binding universal stress UspA family protein
MTNTQLLSAELGSVRPPTDGAQRTVLLATDATPASEPALRMALALSERGADIHALHVVDSRSVPIPPPIDVAVALADAAYGDAFRAQRESELHDTMSQVLKQKIDWPSHVVLGTPWRAITREAARLHADFIVVGLHRHNVIERVSGDETTLQVMREAPCPVVGVTAPFTGVPKRVLVAVDFDQASLEAARTADRLLGPEATFMLAYVSPPEVLVTDDGERLIRDLGVKAAFAWFEGELHRDAGARIEHVTLPRGNTESVADALLTYAGRAAIDMIALGSMHHGRVERWVLGSVTSDIARDGRTSLLVVPPHDRVE